MAKKPPLDPQAVLGLDRSALPRHVAVIMDGNGRWAQERGLPRVEGHRHAIASVREIVEQCAQLGIGCLTLYSFSIENWRRPQPEVDALMALCAHYLANERQNIMDNNVRVVQVGRRAGLPPHVLRELETTESLSRENTGTTLCLALNYGSRTEITDAVCALAERVARGELRADEITEETISGALYTAGLPDPDLVIRTASEMRVSNFLLWQISYAELYVTATLWPDFRAADLYLALQNYAGRVRRFGGVVEPARPAATVPPTST
jgi:undecaprenyl diphosphate synthase